MCVIANAVAGFSLGQLRTFGESKRSSPAGSPGSPDLPFYALSIPKADESGTNAQVGSGHKSDLLRDVPKSMLVPNWSPRPHSITSVAATSKLLGNTSPNAFAVFRLRRNSIFVGSSTGRSLGLAPFSILSTKAAARRHIAT